MSFARKWRYTSGEASESQSFLNDFFNVFGIDRKRVATFETKVPMGRHRNGYIDLLWRGVILIEMKSIGKSLDKAFGQARDYAFHLEDEDLPEYIMVSDFLNIRLYRLITGQQWDFKTAYLHKNIKLFFELAGYQTYAQLPYDDKEVDIKAAEKMAKLHDILKSHGYEGHQLEVYLVRLLFCMFADDTGIFEKKIFYEYISKSKSDGSDLSTRLARLFEVLDTPPKQRIKQTILSDELKRFAYINGKLFSESLPFADFNPKMRKILLECSGLNWGYISPAIFGAMFQGVMNPQERREFGAHYTSEENILKVIKPLFLDDLWEEFERIKDNSRQLEQFHNKLGKLKFLDPACGCGNFLIVTYRELRRIELEVLKLRVDIGSQVDIDIPSYCKINVNQFYGIEYEEFPCQIAQVGMWLIDHQMNTLIAEYFGLYFARLPLINSATIINSNALKIKWENIIPKNDLNFILGNPPFIGYSNQSEEQKRDIISVFVDYYGEPIKNSGKIDYVAGWYYKAAKYIQNTSIRVAFVSTNSIVQGEQVATIWETLMNLFKIVINFAYRTFVWNNEAKGKAAVHCVIIGFSFCNNIKKVILDRDKKEIAENINPYLINAPNVFIKSRSKPICNVPEMVYGNKPADGGHLIIEADEYENFVKNEPQSIKYIKPILGALEYINNSPRWCLWLINAEPSEIKEMPLVLERLELVRKFRLSSPKKATQMCASTPSLFMEIRQPNCNYIIIPRHSSEKRAYIPIGFVDKEVIVNDAVQILPNATLYHFGILTSKIHMIWVKTVCGRIKSDFRYSKDIVYNNFPWPNPTEKQIKDIEKAAQEILNVRSFYSNSSLADLYNHLTMPSNLMKAHNNLDRVVEATYGYKGFKAEAERVAYIMERYLELASKK